MLEALRETRLVDVEAGIERLDGDHQVDRIQAPRNLVAQVDHTVAGIAGQSGHCQEPVHPDSVDHFAQTKRPPKGGPFCSSVRDDQAARIAVSRRQRVRIDFALGDIGEKGVGLFLFQKAVVQQHLVVTQFELAGKGGG